MTWDATNAVTRSKRLVVRLVGFSALAASLLPSALADKRPECSGTENWATSMAYVHLKNADIAHPERIDFARTKTRLLASERIGKDLYRQIHHVVFTERGGGTIEVITSNEASSQECSMSGVQVFVVSRRLGE